MQLIELKSEKNMSDACKVLYNFVHEMGFRREPLCLKIIVESVDIKQFLIAGYGFARSYFKSRDQDLELCGLGLAHKLAKNWLYELNEQQFYVGGMSFDARGSRAPEWAGFDAEFFILPLLQIIKTQRDLSIILNYHVESQESAFNNWRDQALSLLRAQLEAKTLPPFALKSINTEEGPDFKHYERSINKAKSFFSTDPKCRKVVLGRRNTRFFAQSFDPAHLFFDRVNNSSTGFSFLLDAARGGVFFGISPELLYRRLGCNFETESLAGTRPRSSDKSEDARLQQELFASFKDKIEHALVCEYIEKRLKDFGVSDIFTSRLEIMTLPFVRHLVKRYHGHINPELRDYDLLKALHPTPAVGGLDSLWALDFIAEHENFDRGFYAGPIGYVGHSQAEFAVAIRSALYWQQKLFVYAACGIVPESDALQEWEELSNKQKNIMSIFE